MRRFLALSLVLASWLVQAAKATGREAEPVAVCVVAPRVEAVQQGDALGVGYSYRALVVAGHKRQGARGYFYLQRNPNDLTVGWLVRD